MALSLSAALYAKQRVLAETRKPSVQALLKALFSHLQQHRGNPDLQVVFYSALAGTDVVIADAACTLFAWYIKKPSASATAAYVKGSNHASALSETAQEFCIYLPDNEEVCLVFPDGINLGTGLTIGSNTTADGIVGTAAADRPDGFCVIGGA